MDLADWFKGFEKGIAKLAAEQREQFFSECGKHCVQCGTLQIYKDLYEQAAGDLDQFFAKANELPGVRCEMIEKGSVYNLYFLECTCGFINKVMFQHLCSVNALSRASFMFCIRCGRIENLTWLSVARYYAEILSARCA